MTTLADQLERLASRDVKGWIANAIRNELHLRFGIMPTTKESLLMAEGAIAAMKEGRDG